MSFQVLGTNQLSFHIPNSCSLRISKQNSIISSNHWEILKNRQKSPFLAKIEHFQLLFTLFEFLQVFEICRSDLIFEAKIYLFSRSSLFEGKKSQTLVKFRSKKKGGPYSQRFWWSKHENFTVRVWDPGHSVSSDRGEKTLVTCLPVVFNSNLSKGRHWTTNLATIFKKVSIKIWFRPIFEFLHGFWDFDSKAKPNSWNLDWLWRLMRSNH